MFRFVVLPLLSGILAGLLVYFVWPELSSESRIVSDVAQFVLNLSNAYLNPTPSFIVSYIAELNLLVIAISAGIIAFLTLLSVVIIMSLCLLLARGIVKCIPKKKPVVKIVDLPPIEMQQKAKAVNQSAKTLGRGFDSIERD